MGEYYNYLENLVRSHGYKNITEFAKAAGVPRANFTEMAKGRSPRPNIENGIKMADCLGVSLDTIYHREEESPATYIEMDMIKKYRALDERGKFIVEYICDAETNYLEVEQEERSEDVKVIPLFAARFAAGTGDEDFGNPFEEYIVKADSPAEFAIHVNGDSMEPYLPDGSIALCRKQKPKDGEVGAFLLDGALVCKQVCQDITGDVHLFSLNRDRRDADRDIAFADIPERLSCFGSVLMQRVPLPLR